MRSLAGICRAIADWCVRLPGENQADRLLRVLTAVVVLFFPAACLLINRSDSASLLLLAITGLYVWVRNGFKSGLTRRDWLFVAAFAGFFLAGVLAFEFGHQTDEGFRLLGRYLRFLFVLPVLLALRRYPPPAPIVWTGLGVGALVLGVDAIWESVDATGFLRPDGDTNVAILFGDLATLTTFIFAAGYTYVDTRLPRIGPVLVMVCMLVGLMASFLSGTRGAWIAVPILLVLFLSCRHLLRVRIVLAGTGVVITLFAGLLLLPQTHMRERLTNAYTQIRVYLAGRQGVELGPDSPTCMQDPLLLDAWAGIAQIQPGSEIRLASTTDYVPQRAPASWPGCDGRGALLVENLGDTTARLKLPHFVRSNSRTTELHLLVAGDSYFIFGPLPWTRVRTPPGKFVRLDMSAESRLGDFVAITLMPHWRLWLVPVETYPGEYRYTLPDSSIGQRMEMWLVAWHLFLDAPLTGVGTGAYRAAARSLVASDTAPQDIGDFDHPHSDYFDAISSRGLVGLLTLLLLLGIPAWLYMRKLDSRDPHCMGAALGGLLVVTGFAIFGLTETMFIHSLTIGWYVVMTAVFLVSVDAPGGQWTDKQ